MFYYIIMNGVIVKNGKFTPNTTDEQLIENRVNSLKSKVNQTFVKVKLIKSEHILINI